MDKEYYIQVIHPRFWYIPQDKLWLWLWLCNALRAMANSRAPSYFKALRNACTDQDEHVRDMAGWTRLQTIDYQRACINCSRENNPPHLFFFAFVPIGLAKQGQKITFEKQFDAYASQFSDAAESDARKGGARKRMAVFTEKFQRL